MQPVTYLQSPSTSFSSFLKSHSQLPYLHSRTWRAETRHATSKHRIHNQPKPRGVSPVSYSHHAAQTLTHDSRYSPPAHCFPSSHSIRNVVTGSNTLHLLPAHPESRQPDWMRKGVSQNARRSCTSFRTVLSARPQFCCMLGVTPGVLVLTRVVGV